MSLYVQIIIVINLQSHSERNKYKNRMEKQRKLTTTTTTHSNIKNNNQFSEKLFYRNPWRNAIWIDFGAYGFVLKQRKRDSVFRSLCACCFCFIFYFSLLIRVPERARALIDVSNLIFWLTFSVVKVYCLFRFTSFFLRFLFSLATFRFLRHVSFKCCLLVLLLLSTVPSW